jgi:hypothetical protein
MPFGAINIKDLGGVFNPEIFGHLQAVTQRLEEACQVQTLADIRRWGGVPALEGLSEEDEEAVLKSITSA